MLGALLFWATSVCCRSCGDTAIGVAMVMLAAYPCHYNFIYFLTSAFVFGIAKGLLFTGRIKILVHSHAAYLIIQQITVKIISNRRSLTNPTITDILTRNGSNVMTGSRRNVCQDWSQRNLASLLTYLMLAAR